MLIIVGTLVTLLSVFGGYALAGGHLGALIQPVEILMIVGAGVGAFILGNGGKTIKATLRVLPTLFKAEIHEGCLHGADGASLRAAREGTQGRHAHARGRHRRSGKADLHAIPEDPRRSSHRRIPDRLPAPDGGRQHERVRDREPDGRGDRDAPRGRRRPRACADARRRRDAGIRYRRGRDGRRARWRRPTSRPRCSAR